MFDDLAESEATNKISPRRLEVFVQSGGNLDILLTVHGPLEAATVFSVSIGLIIVYLLKTYLSVIFVQGDFEDPLVKESIDVIKETESESQTFVTEFKPKSPGTYAFCLDNRGSRFLSKTVQVEHKLDPK